MGESSEGAMGGGCGCGCFTPAVVRTSASDQAAGLQRVRRFPVETGPQAHTVPVTHTHTGTRTHTHTGTHTQTDASQACFTAYTLSRLCSKHHPTEAYRTISLLKGYEGLDCGVKVSLQNGFCNVARLAVLTKLWYMCVVFECLTKGGMLCIFVTGTIGLSGRPGEQISVSHQELQKEVQPHLIDQQALVGDFLPGENGCFMCYVINPGAGRLHVL